MSDICGCCGQQRPVRRYQIDIQGTCVSWIVDEPDLAKNIAKALAISPIAKVIVTEPK
jgi:hypothetical protein